MTRLSFSGLVSNAFHYLSVFSDRGFSVFLFLSLMLSSDTLLILQRFYVLSLCFHLIPFVISMNPSVSSVIYCYKPLLCRHLQSIVYSDLKCKSNLLCFSMSLISFRTSRSLGVSHYQ